MMTALSIYGNTTSSTTLSTADTLIANTTGGGTSSKTTLVGTATGYGELGGEAITSAWPALGSLPNPTGKGWLLDSTLLEGQTLAAGTWTCKTQIKVSVGSVTATIYMRAYKRSSSGVYTLIGTASLAGQTITTTAASFTMNTGTSFSAMSFSTGDKLYVDIWLNVTSNSTGSGSATITNAASNTASKGTTGNTEFDTAGYSPTANPVLSTSPTSLSFSDSVGGSNPASQNDTLSETAGIATAWTSSISYGSGSGWLSISPTSGSLAASGNTPISVSCTTGSLTAGTYTATITFTATTGGATATISVTFTVANIPILGVTSSSLSFSATQGGSNPAGQSDTLQNTGTATANWTSSITYGSGSGWLSVFPASGTLAAGNTTGLTINCVTGSLAAGTYTATITFTAGSSSTTISITFTITAFPSGLSVTIGGTLITLFEGSWRVSDKIDQQSSCSFTIIDSTGTASFSKYQPVMVHDSVLGTIFNGIVSTAKAVKLYPNPNRMWNITCVDQTYLLSKRTSKKTYNNQYAGTIVADQIQRYASAEGVTGAFALDWDELLTDWAAGTLSGLSATANASDGNVGDGDLELSPAGTDSIFGSTSLAYRAGILVDTPIRYYRLGETSGTVATDLGSQAQNGTITGDVTLNQPGLIAQDSDTAMSFDGSSGYVSLPITGLPTGAQPWTLEAWVKMPAFLPSGSPTIIAMGTDSGNEGVYIICQGSIIGLVSWSTELTAAGGITAGAIYHLVATYDGTTGKFYINGNLIGSAAYTFNLTLGYARIGADSSGDYWLNIIDEVAIYNYALSASRIAVHYTNGLGTGVGGFTGNALKLTATAQAGYASAVIYRKVWSGSQTVVSGDSLSYDEWIPSTNPGIYASVDMAFGDGTFFSANAGAGNDGQGIGPQPSNDLTGLASDQWYSRNHGVSGSVIGKVIKGIYVTLYATQEGDYEAYFRRIVWRNGNTTKITVFSDTSTAPSVNIQGQNTGFLNGALSVVATSDKIVQATSSVNLASVAIVKKSSIAWQTASIGLAIDNASAVLVESSIDNGLSWMTCTNGGAIPQLIAGMKTSSLTLKIRKTLTQTTNPDAQTTISGLQIIVQSSYASSKVDVSKTYAAADFPGGTNSNTITNGSNLTMSGKLVPFSSTSDYNGVTTAFGGASGLFLYRKTLAFNNSLTGASILRLDGVGNTWKDFTVEIDVYISPNATDENGLTFRTTNFGSGAAAFSYFAGFTQTSVVLKKGTNTTGGSSITTIQTATVALNAQSTHRLKIVTSGTSITVYCDDVQMISATDSSFNIAGYFGLRLNNTTGTFTQVYYSNFGVSSALSGIWTAASQVSIAGATTYGTSLVFWDDNQTPDTTSIAVNVSYDNGFSWTACTNGTPLPGLTTGQSLTGKNVLLQVVLTSNNASVFPSLASVGFIVMGQYSSTGTRISPALSLASVLPRAGTALVNWNANQLTNTSVTVQTSIDNQVSWQGVAAPGDDISGITIQPDPIVDSFATDTSADYTSGNFASGTNGTWSWDTANDRITGSGGSNASLTNNTALTQQDSYTEISLDQVDDAGLLANYQDANNFYRVRVWDSQGTSQQNTIALYKRSGGTSTQLGSNATISFPRGTYHAIRLDVQAGVLTVTFDGNQVIQQTDGSPLAAGKYGLYENGLIHCYNLRAQAYGDDVHSKTVYTKVTLTSTDPTVTPQMLDMQAFVSSPAIGPGTLIPSANYVNTFLSDNFNNLNTQSDSWWNIVNKVVIFQARNATPAPWLIASVNQSVTVGGQQIGDVLVDSLTLEPNGDLYRNRMTIENAIDTATFEGIKTGDGTTRSWNMTNPLVGTPTILLNNQLQTVGIYGVDTGKDFYWQSGSTAINQDSGGIVLGQIDQLSITGPCSFEVDVTIDNTGVNNPNAMPYPTVYLPGTFTQGQMAALDGSSGIVEALYDATGQGITKDAATTLATQWLQRYGLKDGRTLTFKTLRSGLQSGQQLTAFVPEQNCIDIPFLVVQVDWSVTTLANGVQQYFYQITAMESANIGNWVRIFSSLLSG